ncbi:DUF1398 family protein [Escherichia coli]|uniref:DUF1398 family protein n=1 Tax=Escherichia coli TaxID=562 RepID=UPI000C7E32E7|nr:hypothetical protein CFI09_14195 [Escherichia coli]EEQ5902612.1 DUF1398 domain-containing protein [Escherichia coli]QWV75189.1 DUF1398 domain-containing protein [Escherichia coli O170:H18]
MFNIYITHSDLSPPGCVSTENHRLTSVISALISLHDNNIISVTDYLKRNGISHCFYFLSTGNIRFTTHNQSMITVQTQKKPVHIKHRSNNIWTKLVIKKHLSGRIPFFRSHFTLSRAGIFKYVLDVNRKQCHYYSIQNNILHSQFIIPVSSTIAPDWRPCGCNPRPVYAAKPGVYRF